MVSPKKKPSLSHWIRTIQDEEMPIFGHTVQDISNVADNDMAPAAQLAKVVLQDASMTTRVLKLANSICYNPQSQRISTVSRAVTVLGFNTVRNMCLSITLVDALVRGKAHTYLTRTLARAIHSAVQANSIAIANNDESPEEVFIATLLYHIGEMAFWCFGGSAIDELDEALQEPNTTPEQAQRKVLGFLLTELSAGLANEWRLNTLLQQVLNHPRDAGRRGQTIFLAHQIAESAERYGWHSPETIALQEKIAKFSGISNKECRERLHKNAIASAEIATTYGTTSAASAIPLPGDTHPNSSPVLSPEALAKFPQPDGALQLKVLRELSLLLESGSDFNIIMEMAMEGIHRGVGMDRVLFALITPDKKGLRAKFALGHESEAFSKAFHFTRISDQRQILFENIATGGHMLVDVRKKPELKLAITNSMTSIIGDKPFLIASIEVNGRGIGLLFADRAPSGRELDDECVESFRHFSNQASMGLSLIASRRTHN